MADEKPQTDEIKLSAELRLELRKIEAEAEKNADPLLPAKKIMWWGIATFVIFAILWVLSRIL